MKDISFYFKPIDSSNESSENSIGSFVQSNDENGFPELVSNSVAVFEVPEYRNSQFKASSSQSSFRSSLNQMYAGDSWTRNLYDLGIVSPGETINDTYFAVGQIITELVKNDIIPIIIGGSQDLTLACYKGFESLERMINICSIDYQFDLGDPNKDMSSEGYVSHLLMQRPCYLFNYSAIGIQRPFVQKQHMELFENLYFDICRLGEFNSNTKVAEPILRNSDVLSIDFKSLKSTETDINCYENPNGIDSEQICQLAKYAGISDKLSCLGVFDVDPAQNANANNLLAQIIWYFIDGVSQRMGDFPIGSKKNYTKFYVQLDDFSDELVFYKSQKSGRWWLEVKYNTADTKYDRHVMVPCNREDYDNAVQNAIPNLWWKTLQKLS